MAPNFRIQNGIDIYKTNSILTVFSLATWIKPERTILIILLFESWLARRVPSRWAFVLGGSANYPSIENLLNQLKLELI